MKPLILIAVMFASLLTTLGTAAEMNKVNLTIQNLQANSFQVTAKKTDGGNVEVTITRHPLPSRPTQDMAVHLTQRKATLEIRDSSSLLVRCKLETEVAISDIVYKFETSAENLPKAYFDLKETESRGTAIGKDSSKGDETEYTFCVADVIK